MEGLGLGVGRSAEAGAQQIAGGLKVSGAEGDWLRAGNILALHQLIGEGRGQSVALRARGSGQRVVTLS